MIKADESIAGAVFFLVGSKTILYLLIFDLFNDFLTCDSRK